MLIISTLLWDANESSRSFSRCYDEIWVEKLYRGFARNLTIPFRFVLFTDRDRRLAEPIDQEQIVDRPSYRSAIEPYRLNEPMILVGLDTVVVGNIDHLAEHCLGGWPLALPRDPNMTSQACTGVSLSPAGARDIYDRHNGEDDMEWMRRQPHIFIDDVWPGHVVSYKGHVRDRGLGDARIVYFHGNPKMQDLPSVPWVQEHWR